MNRTELYPAFYVTVLPLAPSTSIIPVRHAAVASNDVCWCDFNRQVLFMPYRLMKVGSTLALGMVHELQGIGIYQVFIRLKMSTMKLTQASNRWLFTQRQCKAVACRVCGPTGVTCLLQ